MESHHESFHHAVVVCTRNRPEDVRRLMDSLVKQICSRPFLVLIVDASDKSEAQQVRDTVESGPLKDVVYVEFPHSPSLAQQRNFGVEHLPESIEIVHFLDDDVSLEPGYLETLTSALEADPEIGGIGGRVISVRPSQPKSPFRAWVSRFFLLESAVPGRVLPSGGLTGAQSLPLDNKVGVECLGGCASYRCELVRRLRFDDRLHGYSMDEDLDFSYRVGQITGLIVDPSASLIHHVSQTNRQPVRESRRDLIVYRYWFIEKNLSHPLKKPAYWWKVMGSYLMASFSRNPDAVEARKGIADGIRIVVTRNHPILERGRPS